jgi:IstB-like ATP binding protein
MSEHSSAEMPEQKRQAEILISREHGYWVTSHRPFCRSILDDWGLAPFSDEQRRDLLEIIEDRHDYRATLVTSQLPVEHWHEALGIRRWPMRSSTVWCTMPTRSPCRANPCGNGRQG